MDARGSSGKQRLTIDGYNDRLKLAFEYQGPHHFEHQEVMEADQKKVAVFVNAACS